MKKPTQLFTALAATLVLGLGLAGCSTSSPDPDAGDKPPFQVLAIVPLTGPLAASATLAVNGLTAGADAVNERGGIDGREVTIKVVDDKADPTQAVTLLQAEINSATPPDFVWAGASSTEALALVPILSNAKIVAMSPAGSLALNDPAAYPYYYSVSAPAGNDQNYPHLLQEALSRGAEKIGFIVSNDAYGISALEIMTAAAEDEGVELIVQTFDPTATDLAGPMDAIRAQDPDILLMSSYGAGAGYLLDAREKLGWDIETIGDGGIANSNPAGLVDESAWENVTIQAPSANVLASKDNWQPTAEGAIESIKAQGDITSLVSLALSGYDAIELIAQAAAQAGGTSADELKEALENLETLDPVLLTLHANYGFTSDYHFPSLGDGDIAYIPIAEIKDGQFQ